MQVTDYFKKLKKSVSDQVDDPNSDLNMGVTMVKDAGASFAANTGRRLGQIFNNLPLPIMSGKEIQQHYESKLSPVGADIHANHPVLSEVTDPVNLLTAGGGTRTKIAGAMMSPVSDAAMLGVKKFGQVLDYNRAAKAAAKRRF